jgi:hypothetical protein
MSRSHPVLFSLLLRRFGWCLCLFGFVLSLVTASAQSLRPEISVERPAGINIADGSSSDLGALNVGSTGDAIFTIKNTGSTDLILSGTPKVVFSGTHASLFTITAQPTSPVAPASSTTFTVRFAPTSAGAKTAALSIANDDTDENPFDIQLTGTGLGAGPLSGTDNFNDNSKDPTTWAAIDVTAGGASLVEANGRLEYRVSTPDVIMLSTYTTIRKSSLQGKFQFYRDGTATAAPFDWLSRSPTSGFPLHPLDVTTGK